MKKISYSIFTTLIILSSGFRSGSPEKLVSKNTHISFYSHTVVEDITAHNYKVVSTLDVASGDVAFSVPMQSFEFEKALMQEHFNGNDFLNTKAFPKAKFVGKISNVLEIDFSKDGVYPASVTGQLTIKDATNPIQVNGTITVENGNVKVNTKFKLVLADYGITFKKGKPSTNVAKEIEVSVTAGYLPDNS
jgi:polyisoprenoid-binding protein YceI